MLTKEQYIELKRDVESLKGSASKQPMTTLYYWEWAEMKIAEYERTNGIGEEN